MANLQYSKLSLVMQNMDAKHAAYFNSLHRDDRLFLQQRIEHFPAGIQNLLISRYKSHTDQVKANIDLRSTSDKLNALLPHLLRNNFNVSEDELRDLAQEYADICRNKILTMQRKPLESVKASRQEVLETVNVQSCTNAKNVKHTSEINFVNAQLRNAAHDDGNIEDENSVNASLRNEVQLLVYQKCTDFVNGLGLTAPTPDKSKTLTGCIKRMQDKSWWLRAFGVFQASCHHWPF